MARSRRGEILGVAARIFNQKGYLNATLEDVGEDLGFTRAALYYYFKSKQAILTAIVDDAAETLTSSLDAILTQKLPPRECLRRIVVNHVTVLHSRPDVFGVFLAEPTSLPEDVRERMREAERNYIDKVAAVYERGVKAKVFSREFPPRATILLVLGMANSTSQWVHPAGGRPGNFDPEAVGEHIFTMVADGFSTGSAETTATVRPPSARARSARKPA